MTTDEGTAVAETYAHFVGIGGAGMSALAKVLHDRGCAVTGSDLKASRYATALMAEGVPVAVGHAAKNVGDPRVVVVSSAIPETNPEVVEARRRGIEVWPRARMLAHLAGDDLCLAVAGTHGKTTTSSMLAAAIDGIGLDPTFLIGGELNDMGANARCGSGGHYVVEADESDGSFLYLEPHVAVVTNIEADHLDHYRDLADVTETFGRFLEKIGPEGAAVVCADDRALVAIARERCAGAVVTYGFAEDADVRIDEAVAEGLGHRYRVRLADGTSVTGSLRVPGVHNVVNATGVLAAVGWLGLDTAGAARALAGFTGVRRRFEQVGLVDGITVVDDYAHHPTEVRATLAAARHGAFERIWVVFQPHRYSRTAALGREFGASFADADRLVLMDVYSAGEAPIPGVSGKTLVDAVLATAPRSRVAYFPHRADVAEYVASRVGPGDLVMTMGAGDVTSMGGELVRLLEARAGGQ